jgi:acylglycerol lipase
MIHKEGEFAGHGGLRVYWQAWLPEEADARAVLLLAHGFGEHGGRYGRLLEAMVPRGFALYALDHRGHGRSEGPRGHVGRFVEFVDDLHALRVRAEEEQRDRPLFLLGHSMGGVIAVSYLLSHASGVSGAILSSPALRILEEPSRVMRWLAAILSRVAPRISFQANVDPEFLSRDPCVGRAYAADPLVHRTASARFFREFQRAIADAHERAPEIVLPSLVLQAGADRLVDALEAKRFVERLGSESKELQLYPGFFHEIFNEIDNERVFEDLAHWLTARLAEIR